MQDCCDNKNIIFTDYYVRTNCGVIHGYKYIHEISCYENKNNLNKNFFSKSFYKRTRGCPRNSAVKSITPDM